MLTSSGSCISLTDKFEPGAEVNLFVIDLVYCFPLHGPVFDGCGKQPLFCFLANVRGTIANFMFILFANR